MRPFRSESCTSVSSPNGLTTIAGSVRVFSGRRCVLRKNENRVGPTCPQEMIGRGRGEHGIRHRNWRQEFAPRWEAAGVGYHRRCRLGCGAAKKTCWHRAHWRLATQLESANEHCACRANRENGAGCSCVFRRPRWTWYASFPLHGRPSKAALSASLCGPAMFHGSAENLASLIFASAHCDSCGPNW